LPVTQEVQPRIRLTGRIAYTPKIHEFPRGGIRVTFSLAEHLDDGSTVYHNVYSTKRFAERIRDRGLQKGDLVELAGSRQLAKRRDKDGTERLVPVIYAYGVKPR
jgi:single-stranded DNA-binding protein